MSVLSVFMRFSALWVDQSCIKFPGYPQPSACFRFYSTSAYSFKVDNLDALAAKYAMDRGVLSL